MIQFIPAVRLGFQRWKDFGGRSSRAEFWWFVLFGMVLSILIEIVSKFLDASTGEMLDTIVLFITIIPNFAVAFRRMHDVNRTGIWFFLPLAITLFATIVVYLVTGSQELFNGMIISSPFIGYAPFIYFAIQKGTEGPNRFGKDPLAGQPSNTIDPVA